MIVKSSRCHFGAIFGFLEPNPAALYTKLRSASINPHQFRCGKRAVSTMVNALHANRMSQKSPTVRSAARMENTWSASVCRLDKPTRTRFCLKPPSWPRPGHPEWIVGEPYLAGLCKGCPSYGHDLDSDKGIRSPVGRHTQFGAVFAPLRGSFPSGNNKHRDCSPPLGETRQFKIQTALIFMLEALRYAGQDPETLDRLASR